jgi:hypothetical protein
MDPHSPNLWHMSDDASSSYTAALNIILNHFNLAMKLANPAWNENIFVWRCELKKGIPKSRDR